MIVEQMYTKCLAQGAYYIQSEGEVAIIDPLREVGAYLKKAEENKANIKFVFETHFHADFVSGHVTLSEKTGAPIIYGPNANPDFKAYIAKDNEEFKLGKLTIKVLHTPGHTMESTTYLLKDENGKDVALFTGDTLFLGDVGRPDLAQKAASITQEDLAGILFDSLRNKIMPLGDDVMVYPAHGAGSACGKSMMKITQDTLGNQKKMNYALRADMTKAEFVKEVTDGLQAPPAYFPLNVKLNKEGYQSIDEVLQSGLQALSPNDIERIVDQQNAIVLDVRKPQDFAQSHIPNALFIGLDGSFAPWVGELIVDINQPIILVVAEGREEEAVTRLARVGFDHTLGVLKGGMEAWKAAGKKLERLDSVLASDFEKDYDAQKNKIVDVRKIGEFQSEHVVNALHFPLSNIQNEIENLPKDQPFYIHCAGGYRSVIAASILKAKGIHHLIDVQGGYNAIKKTTLERTEYVCPTTL